MVATMSWLSDPCMRLVRIAGAKLPEHGSAYLLKPKLENLQVEKVTMLGCVNIGCGEVEVGILECDGALLKAGVNDLGENLGGSHGAKVAWSVIGG
jgi:hypothetical protein